MSRLPPRVEDLLWLNRIAEDGRTRVEMPMPAGETPSFENVSPPTDPSVRERRAIAIRSEEAIYEGRWEAFMLEERRLSWTQRLGFAPDAYDWGPVRRRTSRKARRVNDPDPLLVHFWHSQHMADLWDTVLGSVPR